MTIWYDILFIVKSVSKKQCNMQVDVAIDQLKGLTSIKILISTKEIAYEIEIEHKFNETHVISRKRQFDKNLDDESIIQSIEESFRIIILFT